MFVLVQEATEAVTAVDAKLGELVLVTHRLGSGASGRALAIP